MGENLCELWLGKVFGHEIKSMIHKMLVNWPLSILTFKMVWILWKVVCQSKKKKNPKHSLST